MSHGPISVFSVTMASAGTLTSEVDLGRAWKTVYLHNIAPTSAVLLRASPESAGTYGQVTHPSINSATVAVNNYTIPSAASGSIVPIPSGLRYLKIETTASVANGTTFKVICSD